MDAPPIVIVGAGLGGLALALRLAHRGENVLVLEKTHQIGGRNRPVQVNDCHFDGGPTLLMMLDPFRKLFADVGERLEDHLDLTLCDPGYRVFFGDGSRIESTTDRARMRMQIQTLASERDALGYERLMEDLEALYAVSIPMFVRRNYDSPLDFFGPRQLTAVARHRMLANLGRRVEKYFRDPRLRMLFSFQTMYLGLSPRRAPWVYETLAYMEYGEGIWYPQGGMVAIAETMAALAVAKGARIRTNAEVAKVNGTTVILQGGDTVEARAVVLNADLPYAQRVLLKAPPKRPLRYSCSAFMMYLDYEGQLPKLLHHNVFFGGDFKRNLTQVFETQELPEDPAFYASVSARTETAKAEPGHENLYLLVPCPNLARPWAEKDGEVLADRVLRRLKVEVDLEPGRIRGRKTCSPVDWRDDLNLELGAAFGLSHDFRQSAFFRPGNLWSPSERIYFVGASTVPGNGMPMVLISAELVEKRLLQAGLLQA